MTKFLNKILFFLIGLFVINAFSVYAQRVFIFSDSITQKFVVYKLCNGIGFPIDTPLIVGNKVLLNEIEEEGVYYLCYKKNAWAFLVEKGDNFVCILDSGVINGSQGNQLFLDYLSQKDSCNPFTIAKMQNYIYSYPEKATSSILQLMLYVNLIKNGHLRPDSCMMLLSKSNFNLNNPYFEELLIIFFENKSIDDTIESLKFLLPLFSKNKPFLHKIVNYIQSKHLESKEISCFLVESYYLKDEDVLKDEIKKQNYLSRLLICNEIFND